MGMEQNFWYPHIREPMRHLFRVENIHRCSSDWPLGTKMCNFNQIFGAKIHFFFNGDVLSKGHITDRSGATPKKFPPHKKSRFQAKGHFQGLTPFFGRFGLVYVAIKSPLNFGPSSTNLGGTVRAIKKMTHNNNRPGPGQNYGETVVFIFGRKVFFFSKKTPKIC